MFILKSVIPCEAQIITSENFNVMMPMQVIWIINRILEFCSLRFLWSKEFEAVEGLNEMVSFRDQSYL